MAKAAGGSRAAGSGMKRFEERLERLEELGEMIRRTDIPLDQALKAFEEGVTLARSLEQDLAGVESRIEILMNDSAASPEESPEMGLFDDEG
jgi:exodeoxyribonuclease VII small subunit